MKANVGKMHINIFYILYFYFHFLVLCHLRIENVKETEHSQPSTSWTAGRPVSTHVVSYSKVAPQSRPLEKLPDFDVEAGATWIYPVNYPLRDYQFSMVESALFKNTLISLPTGK